MLGWPVSRAGRSLISLSNQGVRQITALAKSLAGTEFGLRPAPASFYGDVPRSATLSVIQSIYTKIKECYIWQGRLKEMQICKGGTLGNVPLEEGADSLINQEQDISGIEAQLEYSIQTEEEDQE